MSSPTVVAKPARTAKSSPKLEAEIAQLDARIAAIGGKPEAGKPEAGKPGERALMARGERTVPQFATYVREVWTDARKAARKVAVPNDAAMLAALGGTIALDRTSEILEALAPIGALVTLQSDIPSHWSFSVTLKDGSKVTRTFADLYRDLRRESGDTLKGVIG